MPNQTFLILTLVWIMVTTCPALAFPEGEEPVMVTKDFEISLRTQRMSRRFGNEIERGLLRKRTNTALDAIVHLAAYKLKRIGKVKEANLLLKEWKEQWDGYLLRRDLGDHKPFSEWLANKYAVIEFILGVDVCHALRLDDIKIINYAIPVVFSCIDDVDAKEYEKHFVPLVGTTAFWVTFISCVGGTWGTGFMFCSPIAMGCEYLTENFVAPRINEALWNRACVKERTDAGTAMVGSTTRWPRP